MRQDWELPEWQRSWSQVESAMTVADRNEEARIAYRNSAEFAEKEFALEDRSDEARENAEWGSQLDGLAYSID